MIWIQLRGRWRLLWLLPVLLYGIGAWCLAQRDLNIATWGAFLWLLAIGLAGYFLISAAGNDPLPQRQEGTSQDAQEKTASKK